MVDALAARTRRVVLMGVLLALLALLAGASIWKPVYTAKAMLLRNGNPVRGDGFKPRELSMENFASIVRSPDLLRRVSAASHVPVKTLEDNLRVTPERSTDLDAVTVTAPDRHQAVNLANLYAQETVRFTQEMQAAQASESTHRANLQLRELDKEIVVLDEKVRMMALAVGPEKAAEPANQRLEAARDELAGLLSRYTEAHPLVREQRAKIASLEHESPLRLPSAVSTSAPGDDANLSSRSELSAELEIARLELQPLQASRLSLLNLQREANWFIENPPGYYQVFEPATLGKVEMGSWWVKVALVTVFGACVGIALGAGSVAAGEIMDNRIKTAADLRRVTGLPVLASLGDLKRMSGPAQARWAFHAWTSIRSRLDHAGGRALICGVTAARSGQGVSTWIGLLADAARERGTRVLTIGSVLAGSSEEWRAEEPAEPTEGERSVATTGELLASPARVLQQLVGAGAIVRIPLLDWVWDFERREQWKAALRQWRSVDNLLLLIELPPASQPETVMLAETLPNIIWLAESGKTDAAETAGQIETLRCAGSHVVGAVLNREPAPPTRRRFLRWLGCGVAAALTMGNALAAEPGSAVKKSASPQVTLGPGDVLNLSLFGAPDVSKQEVTIGPDGRINFLEAQNVQASGRTVDELRRDLDEHLAAYRRAPRTIVSPVAFRSRKYYVLGRVAQPGTFPLDRPTTIVDAVARAKGLVMAPSEAGMVEQSDMKRAFLVRNGKRVPIDFERLFRDGDLAQNESIQPNDFLFFPPDSPREAFLLGEVKTPGPVTLTPGMTAVRALASRGGFGERAWTKRVLVVRGSLNKPETFVVDAASVLRGRARDLPLQPKDIVYASDKPWAFAEDVLDGAATSFVQSATIIWTGVNVGPIFH